MAVITLTGSNDFMRSREVRRVIDGFVAEQGDLALERLDGDEHEFVRIQEALTSLPFLASKKMVVLRNPSANKKFAEAAEGLLTELPETTELVIVEPKFDKRSVLYKLLKKVTDFREYEALDVPRLTTWLVDYAKEQDAKLSMADARRLIDRVGTNQQLLASEVDKLRLYNTAISSDVIELLTERTPQSTIFALVEAAFGGRVEQALQLYDEQRQLKVEPIQIIAMFAWQLHVLALLVTAGGRSPGEIAGASKLKPYTLSKSQSLARSLSVTTLREHIDALVTIDARSKRETIDLDEALKLYIISLSGISTSVK